MRGSPKNLKKMPFLIQKRHFLLLEVLIAFVIIALCMIPLISPHVFVLTEQKKFVKQVELDHLANLVYGDIVERMYQNEIQFSNVINGYEFEVDDPLLERIKFDKRLPYKGSFHFKEIIHKPTQEAPKTFYLVKLEIRFVPINKAPASYAADIPGTIRYVYELFLVRDHQAMAPNQEGSSKDKQDTDKDDQGEGDSSG